MNSVRRQIAAFGADQPFLVIGTILRPVLNQFVLSLINNKLNATRVGNGACCHTVRIGVRVDLSIFEASAVPQPTLDDFKNIKQSLYRLRQALRVSGVLTPQIS